MPALTTSPEQGVNTEAAPAPTAANRARGRASRALIAVLRFYKRWISPGLPSACRFHPTCSEYMMQAVEKYGVARGVWKGLGRLSRCHPFHEGGFDPVR
jgi:putative membrane protein insertion efficiency factor